MGDAADAIIEGDCCALCGCYFEDSVGYPVACSDCWDKDCGYQEAPEETI